MYRQLKSLNTSPIKTEISDELVAGSNLVQTSAFPSKMVEMLAVNPDLKGLIRYFLTKSSSGIVSLHKMVPYHRITVRLSPDNKTSKIVRQTIFVAVNCNKNEYETKANNIHVISESNLAMSEVSVESEGTYNGIIVVGSPIENYVPFNKETWLQPFNDSTVGEIANNLALKTFFDMQALAESLQNSEEERDPEDIRKDLQKKWEKYVANEEILIQKNYLHKSNLIYADSCALAPVTTAFQHTTSANPYLDSRKLYGSLEAGASYAPTISSVIAFGVITPKEADDETGYKYGQYAVNSNRRDGVVTVPEEQKETTLETTTREILVYDDSGRSTCLQLTVNDISRNNVIYKRSTNLASLPAGTPVKALGKLSLRYKQEKCLAVQFRISDVKWTPDNQSTTSDVSANISTNFENVEELFDDLISQDLNLLQDVDSVSPSDNPNLEDLDSTTESLDSNTGGQAGF